VTNAATNGKSKFLADVPSEIRELLDWYEARAVPGSPGPKLTEFATKFLSGMVEDHAIIPPLAVSAPEVLALKSLRKKTQTIAQPPQELDQITAPPTKDEHVT
jgi:hypothetical protein